ncbi:MAG TPA: prohibitin family protein [candidate division Zixibacteria bacterium]|nr:prohibitin family protein [candidate division Zixibacteria bacterium]
MKSTLTRLLPLFLLAAFAAGVVGCGTQIDSGHRGVFYSKFGSGTEFGKIYPEGFAWHMPWNKMFVYKVQLQEQKELLTVLSSDGATIKMEVSVLYRPEAGKLDSLQVTVGPDYYDVSVAPMLRGISRTVAGRYKPEEIYSTKREEMAKAMVDELRAAVTDKYVTIENVLIRDVTIPAKISEAINFKLTADQNAQRMDFEIEKEKKEAERKKIEAQGIAEFQKIVSSGITPSLLKWKGIEATLKIAESQNTKVVIVGNDDGGLPIILGGN